MVLVFLVFLVILAFLIISIINIRLNKHVIPYYPIDIPANHSSWNWQGNKQVVRVMAISVHWTMIYIGFILLKFILMLHDYVWRRMNISFQLTEQRQVATQHAVLKRILQYMHYRRT